MRGRFFKESFGDDLEEVTWHGTSSSLKMPHYLLIMLTMLIVSSFQLRHYLGLCYVPHMHQGTSFSGFGGDGPPQKPVLCLGSSVHLIYHLLLIPLSYRLLCGTGLALIRGPSRASPIDNELPEFQKHERMTEDIAAETPRLVEALSRGWWVCGDYGARNTMGCRWVDAIGTQVLRRCRHTLPCTARPCLA